MDILAHGLWAGIGVALTARRWEISRRTAVATVAMAVLPDLAQLLPLLGGVIYEKDGVAILRAYATASPGTEPTLPPVIALLTHHLHCIMHSAVIASAVTFVVWAVTRSLWIPILGWWSHIVIDVFTHSAEFYPVPVLYPITEKGFDGLAWNTPWFLVANYVALSVAVALLLLTRSRARRT